MVISLLDYSEMFRSEMCFHNMLSATQRMFRMVQKRYWRLLLEAVLKNTELQLQVGSEAGCQLEQRGNLSDVKHTERDLTDLF